MSKQLRVLRKNLRQDIDSLENRLKWANIAAMLRRWSLFHRNRPGRDQTQTNRRQMNKKQFLILLVLVLVVGGLGPLFPRPRRRGRGGA